MGWRTSDGGAFGGSYESWIDKQIRDAEERGEFDDLPGTGKPLPGASRPGDPDWWIKQKVADESLDLTAAMPLPLQLRKEAQRLPGRIVTQRYEADVRLIIDDYNDRVRLSWRDSYAGLPVHAQLVDADELLSMWREHRAALAAQGPPATEPAPHREPRPGVLRRALHRLARKPLM